MNIRYLRCFSFCNTITLYASATYYFITLKSSFKFAYKLHLIIDHIIIIRFLKIMEMFEILVLYVTIGNKRQKICKGEGLSVRVAQ